MASEIELAIIKVLKQEERSFGHTAMSENRLLTKLSGEVELSKESLKEQEAKIKIIFNIKTPIENFDADPGRIRQMMHNLIRNSIEAIDSKADGLINIIIKPKEINKIAMIEITVEDNGGGFKSQSLGQVFDPYVTSKPKGTGLGLAIVKKLVEEHMGSIEASNTKNNGALISILLPRNEKTRETIIINSKKNQDNGRALV